MFLGVVFLVTGLNEHEWIEFLLPINEQAPRAGSLLYFHPRFTSSRARKKLSVPVDLLQVEIISLALAFALAEVKTHSVNMAYHTSVVFQNRKMRFKSITIINNIY
jgi:hypothetical protein